MFDIGFMEMALIGVVALVVIGPERLPGVARTAGKWIGSARRFMSSVQADINLEVNKAETLKQLLEEQTKIQSVHEILEQTPAESDDRKPVPRAVAAKPEYLVKAINDEPTADSDSDSDAPSGTSSSTISNKHD